MKLNNFVGKSSTVSVFTINDIHQGIFQINGLHLLLSVISRLIISFPHTVTFPATFLKFKLIL
ncbi:MAG: hypothetical protein LBQ59_05250 [Candidatus Peribacteria bacterium]|nr:hypothetical protein [Candidatus Peribacteria bacterium]